MLSRGAVVAWGFLRQLGNDLPVGRSHTGVTNLLASYGHFFFIDVHLAGMPGRWIAGVGLVAAVAAVTLGASRLWRSERRLMLVAAVFAAAPLLAFATALAYPRAGFNWRYVAGAAPAVMLFAACGTQPWGRSWKRHTLATLLWGSMIAMSVLIATAGGREDNQAAVRRILKEARAGDAVVVVPIDHPDGSRSPDPFDYYTHRLPWPTGVARLGPSQLARALAAKRVFVFVRGRLAGNLRIRLLGVFDNEKILRFGADLRVLVYDPGS